MNRLAIALGVLAVLGILAWTTIGNEKLRWGTLAVLALFAVKSWVRRNDVLHPDGKTK